MVRSDTIINFTDNSIEAQIGHMSLSRSGNKVKMTELGLELRFW